MDVDSHERPPEAFRSAFKTLQRLPLNELELDHGIIDFGKELMTQQPHPFESKSFEETVSIQSAFDLFLGPDKQVSAPVERDVRIFEARDLPGLVVIPALIPTSVQVALLAKILHRDLSKPEHKTNVHFHHRVRYPGDKGSFFDLDPSSSHHFQPIDPCTHKSISIQQFLEKKLRWMTLGGQYDWTAKKYPNEKPPDFPQDIKKLLHNLFPSTKAEAAIVNFYSPGDVLSLHRDVSESCDHGLISLSIGCDGLFMIGLGEEDNQCNPLRQVTIRLRSGDAVYMSGESRYAWHGVPRIIPNTCPDLLRAWPSLSGSSDTQGSTQRFNQWKKWLAYKRVNINVRQMFDGCIDANYTQPPA